MMTTEFNHTQHTDNDSMVEELKRVWQNCQTTKDKANQLAQSTKIPHEMVNAIHKAADQHLDKQVYEILFHQENPKEEPKEEHKKEQAKATESKRQEQTTSKGPTSSKRQFYRVEVDRMIAGVCGGVAEYFNVDSALVRVLTVICSLLSVVPPNAFIIVPIAYVVAALLLPLKSEVKPTGENQQA